MLNTILTVGDASVADMFLIMLPSDSRQISEQRVLLNTFALEAKEGRALGRRGAGVNGVRGGWSSEGTLAQMCAAAHLSVYSKETVATYVQ